MLAPLQSASQLTSKTKQFSWNNREQAAQDLLQIVYHSPPSSSQKAIQLLQAIRSPQIVLELVALACDKSRSLPQRFHSIVAITELDSDIYVPELAIVMKELIEEDLICCRNNYTKIIGVDGNLLGEILSLVNHHPSKQDWFIANLNQIEELSLIRKYINRWLSIRPLTDKFKECLMAQLIQVFEQDLKLLNIVSVYWLWREGNNGRIWLNQHFEDVVQVCLNTKRVHRVKHLAQIWNRLNIALSEQIPDFDISDDTDSQIYKAKSSNEDLQDTLGYQFFYDLYKSALLDDCRAYWRLVIASRQSNTSVEWQCTAIYFLGKLIPKYETMFILIELLQSASHEKESIFGRRLEAGRALLKVPTSETWKAMINAYFIENSAFSGEVLLNWIGYITDVLSGKDVSIPKGQDKLKHWLRLLASTPKEELQRMIDMK